MSRHSFSFKDKTISYGLDPILRGYFLQVFSKKDELEESYDTNKLNCWGGTKKFNRGEMIEKLELFGCKRKDHVKRIALDLPI